MKQPTLPLTNIGHRANKGKLRYDLIHPLAERGLVTILTYGSHKYEDRNWEKGLPYMEIIASLKRHIADFELGIDVDKESGLLTVDHIQANTHFLATMVRTHPELEDRPSVINSVIIDPYTKQYEIKYPEYT